MAREVIVRLTDDFDRTQVADEVVKFVFEGVEYTLDLTTKNANEFREYLRPYIDAAHEANRVTVAVKTSKAGVNLPGVRKTQMRSPFGEPPEVRVAIREWAAANGYPNQPRGIVPDDIRQAYTEATGNPVGANVRLRADEVDTSALDQMEKADVDASKPQKTKAAKKTDPKGPNSQGITPEMREWARANGHPLRSNGYLTAELRRQYEAEQQANNNHKISETNGALV